jgi:hypothetical protein
MSMIEAIETQPAPALAGYPAGATPLSAGTANLAAAAGTATLTAAAGAPTYITGFEITGAGATAASVVQVTVTGLLGGTCTYIVAVPAGAAVGVTPLLVNFIRPVPASAVNTTIVVNIPSFGAGNTNATASVHGFRL